jgi:hypothetical protein
MSQASIWLPLRFLTPRSDFTRPEAIVSLGVMRAEYAAGGISVSDLRPRLRRCIVLSAIVATLALAGMIFHAWLGYSAFGFLGLAAGAIALVEIYLTDSSVSVAQPLGGLPFVLMVYSLPGAIIFAYLMTGNAFHPALLPFAYMYLIVRGASSAFLALRILKSPTYLHGFEMLVAIRHRYPRISDLRKKLTLEHYFRTLVWGKLRRYQKLEDPDLSLTVNEMARFPIESAPAKAELVRQLRTIFERYPRQSLESTVNVSPDPRYSR